MYLLYMKITNVWGEQKYCKKVLTKLCSAIYNSILTPNGDHMKPLLAVILAMLCLNAQAVQDNHTKETPEIVLEEIHDSVRERFTYTTGNPKNEVFKYYTSMDEVRGDCDDFASAVYYELWKRGADPTIIVYDSRPTRNWPKGYRHVIVCASGYCFDNNRRNIYSRIAFDRRVGVSKFKVVREGYLKIDKMEQMLSVEVDTRYMHQTGEIMLASNAGGD